MAASDNQSPELFGQTPWQTVGPFFHGSLPWSGGANLADASVDGERITISGRIIDGAGAPVPEALVEIWQADAEGSYGGPDSAFIGFGRCPTGEDGGFAFTTLRPGRVPGPGNVLQAAHIAVGIMARGLITRLVTRLYFEDGEGLDLDPVLAATPEPRRRTLIARRLPGEAARYTFDIVLQGEDETVFLEF